MKNNTVKTSALKTAIVALSLAFIGAATSASAASVGSQVRLANLGSKTGLVDLWVNGQVVATNVDVLTASSFTTVGAGEQHISIFSDDSRFAPLVTTVDTVDGQNYTVTLQDDTLGFGPKLQTFAQNTLASSAAGKVSVNVFNLGVDNLAVLGAAPLSSGATTQVLVDAGTTTENFAWGMGDSSDNNALNLSNVAAGSAFVNNASLFIINQTPDQLNSSPRFVLL
jgi:hypothetical protein